LKVRKNRIKQLNLNFIKFKTKIKLFFSFKLVQNFLFILYIFSLKSNKKNILSLLLLKNVYYVLFFEKNNKIINDSLKNKLSINFLLS
jgi:hypothetical protein